MTNRLARSLLAFAVASSLASPASACIEGTGRHWLFAKVPDQLPAGLEVLKGRVVEERERGVTIELTEPVAGLPAGTQVRVQALIYNCGDEFRTDLEPAYALGRFSIVDPKRAVFLALAFPPAAPSRASREELESHIVEPGMVEDP